MAMENCKIAHINFENCNLKEAEFYHTPLKGIDFTGSDISGIRVSLMNSSELKGATVTSLQALELARMLGIDIKD